jgi:hypothetical protein
MTFDFLYFNDAELLPYRDINIHFAKAGQADFAGSRATLGRIISRF